MRLGTLFIILFLWACGTPETDLKQTIKQLEEKNEREPSADTSQELIRLYTAFVEEHPEEKEMASRFLYRAATLHYRMNKFSPAITLLNQAIKDYYTAENTPNNALLLGSIYKDKYRNAKAATAVYQAFLIAFPDHEKSEEVRAEIPPATPPLEDWLQKLGEELYDTTTKRIDFTNANNYMTVASIYAMLLPKADDSPILLSKAGEVARSMRSFPKAIEFYDWIYNKYPQSEKAPQALFLKAFTLDNEMEKYEEARLLYEEFLAKFPNDDFADDTQFLIDNLGKSEEEIIKSFEKVSN